MHLLRNISSPLRRRSQKAEDDRGFLLNETAIWLVVIAIILGVGGYFGIGFITRTKSAAARQVLDNAVSVADSIYAQQIDGETTFFGGALDDGKALDQAKAVLSTSDEVESIISAWTVAGEGTEFVWWPAADDSDNNSWHKTITDNPEIIYIYINSATLNWPRGAVAASCSAGGHTTQSACASAGETWTPAVSGTTWTIPAGQMLRMATADSDGNTYCAVYVRQMITDSPDNASQAFAHIGLGYQSKKAATPAPIATGTNRYQDQYADCGMEAHLYNVTSPGTVAWGNGLISSVENAELPGDTQRGIRATLGDPE